MDTHTRHNTNEHANFGDMTYANDADNRNDAIRTVKADTKIISGDFGSGWYHDAAIKDANETFAHPYR